MKHLNVLITGRVQGVYFRALTKEKANEFGVKGFVHNQPNGSVYLEAEGTQEQVEKLVEWCRKGPPRARVEKVTITESESKGFTNFEITR